MQTEFKIKVDRTHIKRIKVNIVPNNTNTLYFIESPYDEHLLQELRAMKGSKWNPDRDPPAWSIPICERNEYAIAYLEGHRIARYQGVQIPEIPDSTFKRPLFQAQKKGVSFSLFKRGCLLNYAMGLGKTLMSIEIMERASRIDNAYIWWLVAPLGAQRSWKRELEKWKAEIKPIVVTTYESLHHWLRDLDTEKHLPHGVIFDESIKIKNPNAQRSQYAYELTRLVRYAHPDNYYIILLSGAPAPKEPSEWWHQIECIQPGYLKEGDIMKHTQRLANIEWVDHGYGKFPEIKSWKEDEIASLGKRLRPIVLSCKKEDVLDLPDKIYDEIQCDITLELKRAMDMLIATATSGISALEKLRELSDGFQYTKNNMSNGEIDGEGQRSHKLYTWIGSPKLDIVADLLNFYSKENEGPGRLVIYAAFHATIDKLMDFIQKSGSKTKFKDIDGKSLKKYPIHDEWYPMRIDGRGWSRQDALYVFEKYTANVVIVANPQCVHGLNLQSTEALVYYSNSFSVDARIQSEDRRDRPGMDVSKGTRIIDILHLNTDKYVLERLREKAKLQEITIKEIQEWLLSGKK